MDKLNELTIKISRFFISPVGIKHNTGVNVFRVYFVTKSGKLRSKRTIAHTQKGAREQIEKFYSKNSNFDRVVFIL
tara:strand:+ start:287 stop:514 length:228 start_codon:yes stop_codon:yes gene_type:complete